MIKNIVFDIDYGLTMYKLNEFAKSKGYSKDDFIFIFNELLSQKEWWDIFDDTTDAKVLSDILCSKFPESRHNVIREVCCEFCDFNESYTELTEYITKLCNDGLNIYGMVGGSTKHVKYLEASPVSTAFKSYWKYSDHKDVIKAKGVKAAYSLAIEHFQIEPSSTIYVGDNTKDLKVAIQGGFTCGCCFKNDMSDFIDTLNFLIQCGGVVA